MADRTSLQRVLTRRDLDLVCSLHRYRTLSITQIRNLHFPSDQTAARRVRVLARQGYLTVTRVPGVADRLVTLSEAGLATVARELDLAPADLGSIKRSQPKDHLFVRHLLAVNDFRIALTRACVARAELDLLGFLDDAVCRRTPTGGIERYLRDVVADADRVGATLSRIPDGVFALGRAGKAALFFLEADRGTEPVAHPDRGFIRTLRFYLHYLAAGGYQRYREDFHAAEPFRGFRLLVVTSSRRRLENIRAAGSEIPFEPASAKRFFWLAESAAVTEGSILERIWVSLDPADDARYGMAPSTPEESGP